MQQLQICCPCGAPDLLAKGLCAPCYKRWWHNQHFFGGQRETVVRRDGGACTLCGTRERIVVHHRRRGLITLCRHCHPRVHFLYQLPYGVSPLFRALWWELHSKQTPQLELPFIEEWHPPQLTLGAAA